MQHKSRNICNSCRYSALKEMEHNSHSLCVGCVRWLSPKITVGKKRKKKVTFTVEKTDNHYLSQVIKVSINNLSHIDSMFPWSDMMKEALYLYSLTLKTHNASLIMKELSEKPKYQTNTLQNCQESSKTSLRNCHKLRRA